MPRPNHPDQSYTATYDAWDRLVELKTGSNTEAKYEYDGTDARAVMAQADHVPLLSRHKIGAPTPVPRARRRSGASARR